MQTDPTYDTDFYQWANRQAELLRTGNLSEADIEHIAEEIESMGKSEKREFISRLTVLFVHLLKWQYQPSHQSKSWQLTIKEQRMMITDHLEDNPSLQAKIDEVVLKAYRLARTKAARETGLDEDVFPIQCPFSFDEALNG
jgi:hypothetical protein